MVRVSVIIPTYNRRELVRTAIASVLEQDFSEVEILVADDGSTDGTAELATTYDHRVRFLSLDHLGLLGTVRNVGLAHALGEYVAFLDSDDVWLPGKLARQVDVLDRDPEIGLVCTNARVRDENGGYRGESGHLYLRSDQGASGRVLPQLLNDNFVIVSTVVARRKVIEQVGGFAEEPLLRGVEDYDLWLRIAAISGIAYLPEPLALYREHPSSMRLEVPRSQHWRSMLRILDRLSAGIAISRSEGNTRRLLRDRAAMYEVALASAQRTEVGITTAVWTLTVALFRNHRVAGVLMRRLASRVQRPGPRTRREL